MSRDSSIGDQICPRCGTVVPPGAATCWLCYASLDPAPTGGPAQRQAAGPTTRGAEALAADAAGFSLASLMMFVTLVCVVLGLSTIAPGVGIPLGIVLVAVWLRTAAVTRRRAARGLAVSSIEQMQLFAASFGVTVTILSLIGVAGFAAFWAACFACMGTYFGLEGALGDNIAITLAWIVCAVVALAFLFVALRFALPFLIRLIRRRWQRDIGENGAVNKTANRFAAVLCIGAIVGLLLWLFLEWIEVF